MEQLQSVCMIAMDVDGVLTNGEIVYGAEGEELKAFNILDGCGIAVAREAGLMTAFVTGRTSAAVERRASELGVTSLVAGCRDKGAAILDLAKKHGISPKEIAFIGDDLNDLLAFRRCACRIAVNNACDDLKAEADHVTALCGGSGAVREAIEWILKAQGKWADAVAAYLRSLEQTDAGSNHPSHQ